MSIEKELLERLRKGVYGSDGIVNESQEAFKRALDELEEEEEEVEMESEEEEEVCTFGLQLIFKAFSRIRI